MGRGHAAAVGRILWDASVDRKQAANKTSFHRQCDAYRASPIILHTPRRGKVTPRSLPQPGALAPDAACTLPGSAAVAHVRHLFGNGFVARCLPPNLMAAERAAELLGAPDAGAHYAVVVPPGRGHPDGVGADVLWVHDAKRLLTRTYAPDGDRLSLVRPDGCIAARGRAEDLSRLPALVARAADIHASSPVGA